MKRKRKSKMRLVALTTPNQCRLRNKFNMKNNKKIPKILIKNNSY